MRDFLRNGKFSQFDIRVHIFDRRKLLAETKLEHVGASAMRPNQKWSMDFVLQRLPDGRWMRVLTVVDQFTRECL